MAHNTYQASVPPAPPTLFSGVDASGQPYLYRIHQLVHSRVPVTCTQSGYGTQPAHLNIFHFEGTNGSNLNPRSQDMLIVLYAWVLFWLKQFPVDLGQIMTSAMQRGAGSEIASAVFEFMAEGPQRVSLVRGRPSSTGYDLQLRHYLYTDNDTSGNNTISRIELPYFLWNQTLYVPGHPALLPTPQLPLHPSAPTMVNIDGAFLVSLLTRGIGTGSTLKLSTIQGALLPEGTPVAAASPSSNQPVPITWYGVVRGSGARSVSLVGWNFSSEVQRVYVQKVGQTRTGWVQEMC